MKDTFLFNILGTIADHLRAVPEFTAIKLVLSYHLKLKRANLLWVQEVTICQHQFNLLPCEKQVSNYPLWLKKNLSQNLDATGTKQFLPALAIINI